MVEAYRWLRDVLLERSGFVLPTVAEIEHRQMPGAATALCEAYGLSQYAPYRKFAQKATNYIANARNPYGVWRYQPREPDGGIAMVSVPLDLEALLAEAPERA